MRSGFEVDQVGAKVRGQAIGLGVALDGLA